MKKDEKKKRKKLGVNFKNHSQWWRYGCCHFHFLDLITLPPAIVKNDLSGDKRLQPFRYRIRYISVKQHALNCNPNWPSGILQRASQKSWFCLEAKSSPSNQTDWGRCKSSCDLRKILAQQEERGIIKITKCYDKSICNKLDVLWHQRGVHSNQSHCVSMRKSD